MKIHFDCITHFHVKKINHRDTHTFTPSRQIEAAINSYKYICRRTQCNRALLMKLTVDQQLTNIPAFQGTRRFSIVSKALATAPRPELHHLLTPYLKIYFNIILQSTPMTSKLSLSFRFSEQNFLSTSLQCMLQILPKFFFIS